MKARRILLLLVIAAAAALVVVEPALAQCAMCKATVENSTEAAQASRGLNLAILVLLVPPVAIFAGLFGVFYRFRNVHSGKHPPNRL
jgi:hypothetical protein